jgi:hypothetical protein
MCRALLLVTLEAAYLRRKAAYLGGRRTGAVLQEAENNMIDRETFRYRSALGRAGVRTVDFATCNEDKDAIVGAKLATRPLQYEREHPILPAKERPRSRLGPLFIAATGLKLC